MDSVDKEVKVEVASEVEEEDLCQVPLEVLELHPLKVLEVALALVGLEVEPHHQVVASNKTHKDLVAKVLDHLASGEEEAEEEALVDSLNSNSNKTKEAEVDPQTLEEETHFRQSEEDQVEEIGAKEATVEVEEAIIEAVEWELKVPWPKVEVSKAVQEAFKAILEAFKVALEPFKATQEAFKGVLVSPQELKYYHLVVHLQHLVALWDKLVLASCKIHKHKVDLETQNR